MSDDPVHDWVDLDEIQRLADDLITQPEIKPKQTSDEGFGEDFEGFTVDPVQQKKSQAKASRVLAELREKAEESGIVERKSAPTPTPRFSGVSKPSTSASPAPPPRESPVATPKAFDPQTVDSSAPGSPFLRRIQGFAKWLRQECKADRMFLCDDHGVLIYDDIEDERLELILPSLATGVIELKKRGTSGAKGQYLKVSEEAVLMVAALESRYGLLVLGWRRRGLASEDEIAWVAQNARLAIDPESGLVK